MFKNKTVLIVIIILVAILLAILMTNKSAGKSTTDTVSDPAVTLDNGVQVVKMSESARGYSPKSITIKKGIPVRWEIEASADRTCASALIVPDYQIRAFLKPGKNIIEFTPNKTGSIPFSCSMRMYTGMFTVID